MDLAAVRKIALTFPGMEEGTSYGTPAFRVRKKLLARLHESGDALVLRAEPEARDALLDADPRTFYVTDHYAGHPWVLVRLAVIRAEQLAEVIEQAWRRAAPKSLVARFDARE